MIISKNYEGFILRNKALFHVRRLWAGAYMTNFLGGLRLNLIWHLGERQNKNRKCCFIEHTYYPVIGVFAQNRASKSDVRLGEN